MGLATAQLRVMYLTLYKSDLEYKIQLITQTQMGLANSVNDLVTIGSDLDASSPEMKLLEQRRERLALVEKKLEAAMKMYQTKLQMVETELESAQKIVDKNIQRFFKYGGGG